MTRIARTLAKKVLPARFLAAARCIAGDGYHRHSGRVADCVRQSIERHKGPLHDSIGRACEEYAVEVLGGLHHAPWLKVYAAVAGAFKEGWIPDNYYVRIVLPRLKGDYGNASELRPLASLLFEPHEMPETVCQANGILFDHARRIVSPDRLCQKLGNDSQSIVFKPDFSRQGTGVVVLSGGAMDEAAVRRLGNGVFQTYVQQHESLSRFAAGSVATLRFTTVVGQTGTVWLRSCYLRLGIDQDTHVRSQTAVRVPIDTNDGSFSAIGFTADWLETDRHPTSGIAFAGNVIPGYEACVALVLSLQQRVPFVPCVGWDVTVDSTGTPRLLEWNGAHNDIKFSEATQGPCFGDLGWQTLWRHPA